MNTEEIVEDDMDPVAVLEARAQEAKNKKPEVPAMVETFIAELSEMYTLLREWDYPAMEHVKDEFLSVFVGIEEEPLPAAEAKPLPWYRRLLKKAPARVQVAVMRKEVTRKAAAWEVASVNPKDISSLYIEIYIDVKDGTAYFKNLHQPLAYELRPDHLLDCSFADMERLLDGLRTKRLNVAYAIKNVKWREESSEWFAQEQAAALEAVRERLGIQP